MIINELPYWMTICLLSTIFTECMIALILKVRNKKDILNIILVNIMTNPIVVAFSFYINIKYGLLSRYVVITILEILVILSEGYIYKKYLNFNKINPFVLAIILNGTSFFIGQVIKIIY